MQFFFLSSSSNGSKYYFLSLSFLVLSLFCAIHVLNSSYNHSFETRHGPAGRHRTRPTRGWNRVGLKKKQGKKNPVWPGKTWLKTRLQPVNFFFTKTMSFWFFYKKNWPGQPGDPVKTRALNRAGSKNYGYSEHYNLFFFK